MKIVALVLDVDVGYRSDVENISTASEALDKNSETRVMELEQFSFEINEGILDSKNIWVNFVKNDIST